MDNEFSRMMVGKEQPAMIEYSFESHDISNNKDKDKV